MATLYLRSIGKEMAGKMPALPGKHPCSQTPAYAVTSRNSRMIFSSACFNSASIAASGRGGVYV